MGIAILFQTTVGTISIQFFIFHVELKLAFPSMNHLVQHCTNDATDIAALLFWLKADGQNHSATYSVASLRH